MNRMCVDSTLVSSACRSSGEAHWRRENETLRERLRDVLRSSDQQKQLVSSKLQDLQLQLSDSVRHKDRLEQEKRTEVAMLEGSLQRLREENEQFAKTALQNEQVCIESRRKR